MSFGLSVGDVLAVTATLSSLISETLVGDYKDFGAFRTALLVVFLPEARSVIARVRHYVLQPDQGLRQAKDFKDSYSPTLSMIGVAGAILAQIALTALALPDINQTHWTVQAAFVVSLVAGALSVYFACVLQNTMSGMQTPAEVRDWLTRPRAVEGHTRLSLIQLKARVRTLVDLGVDEMTRQDPEALAGMRDLAQNYRDEVVASYRPSFSAALILTAPSQLLNLALLALLTGLGIYFGLVYTANLPAIDGQNSALAIFVVYLVTTSCGALLYYGPAVGKLLNVAKNKEMHDLLEQIEDMVERLPDHAPRHHK